MEDSHGQGREKYMISRMPSSSDGEEEMRKTRKEVIGRTSRGVGGGAEEARRGRGEGEGAVIISRRESRESLLLVV